MALLTTPLPPSALNLGGGVHAWQGAMSKNIFKVDAALTFRKIRLTIILLPKNLITSQFFQSKQQLKIFNHPLHFYIFSLLRQFL
jgi:hypothetical protein